MGHTAHCSCLQTAVHRILKLSGCGCQPHPASGLHSTAWLLSCAVTPDKLFSSAQRRDSLQCPQLPEWEWHCLGNISQKLKLVRKGMCSLGTCPSSCCHSWQSLVMRLTRPSRLYSVQVSARRLYAAYTRLCVHGVHVSTA